MTRILTSTNTLSIVALPQETVNATDRECKPSLGRAPGGSKSQSLLLETMEKGYQCGQHRNPDGKCRMA